MQDSDFNQDAEHERPNAATVEAMTDRIAAVLSAQHPSVFDALQPTNGLTTDPRYMERQRAIRRLARRIADAVR